MDEKLNRVMKCQCAKRQGLYGKKLKEKKVNNKYNCSFKRKVSTIKSPFGEPFGHTFSPLGCVFYYISKNSKTSRGMRLYKDLNSFNILEIKVSQLIIKVMSQLCWSPLHKFCFVISICSGHLSIS